MGFGVIFQVVIQFNFHQKHCKYIYIYCIRALFCIYIWIIWHIKDDHISILIIQFPLHRTPGGRPLPRAALRLFPALLGAAPAWAEKGVTTAWKTRPDGGEDGAALGKGWEKLGMAGETMGNMGVDMGWWKCGSWWKWDIDYGNSWVFFVWILMMLRGAGTLGRRPWTHEENQTMVPVTMLIDVDERCWGIWGSPRLGTNTELEFIDVAFRFCFPKWLLNFSSFMSFSPKLTERET